MSQEIARLSSTLGLIYVALLSESTWRLQRIFLPSRRPLTSTTGRGRVQRHRDPDEVTRTAFSAHSFALMYTSFILDFEGVAAPPTDSYP
jgi:hypothetical protein